MQFYSPFGQLLRTLRVPGTSLRSLSWEGSGLRLSLAVDSHIFFANVRPAYMWTYFSTTLAYATWRKEKGEHHKHRMSGHAGLLQIQHPVLMNGV